ncbi:MAG: 50S ribosomal protein L23 [Minisyncoccota bacterium]
MAIFKKTTEKKVPAKKTEEKLGSRVGALVRPHITEKAALLAEKGTYVFVVAPDTNKIEVAKAVTTLYGVTPVKVNIVNLPDTNVFVRNRRGVKAGVRKALVTLKKGDKIELI